MAQHRSRRRPKPERAPQQPRDRLAEIRAEIREVQQQIDAQRRDAPVIRTAADLKTRERTFAELTDRLAALLLTEAMQAALGDPENRRQARSLAQGAGHTLKDQGPRDVTLRTARGQSDVPDLAALGCARPLYGGARFRGQQDGGDAGLVGRGRAGPARSWTTPGPQDHPGDRLSVRRARPYRPACRECELGRDRRGPSRGPVHRWGPDPDSHDQARPEDRQGTPPLSHGLARAEVADHLRRG